jgi:formyl-CoA transferase
MSRFRAAAHRRSDNLPDQRPFVGITIVDMTRVLAGSFCAYQLGLLGAEVIKIERPGKGETIRWRTEADPSFGKAGLSLGFMTQSANKHKSVHGQS